jgi:RNA polymerase sigma-70 factor (ECF subfamily)
MVDRSADSGETDRLLIAARRGEASARDLLFTKHRDYLRRFVEIRADPRIRARVDPSDAVQDAQLEAARRLDAYLANPVMPFRLWLRQIAQDRLTMLQRRHVTAGRRTVNRDVALPARSSVLLARQLLTGGPTPQEHLLRTELARRVREAVARLAETDREIILLRNFEGLSNQEAAQLLDIERVAASKRYGRALLRLRDIFVQSGMTEQSG